MACKTLPDLSHRYFSDCFSPIPSLVSGLGFLHWLVPLLARYPNGYLLHVLQIFRNNLFYQSYPPLYLKLDSSTYPLFCATFFFFHSVSSVRTWDVADLMKGTHFWQPSLLQREKRSNFFDKNKVLKLSSYFTAVVPSIKCEPSRPC